MIGADRPWQGYADIWTFLENKKLFTFLTWKLTFRLDFCRTSPLGLGLTIVLR